MQLQNYGWPGNVRELLDVIMRAVIVSKGNRLRLVLKQQMTHPRSELSATEVEGLGHILTEAAIRQLEKQKHRSETLRRPDLPVRGTACLLGLPPTTLFARINKMGIKKA